MLYIWIEYSTNDGMSLLIWCYKKTMTSGLLTLTYCEPPYGEAYEASNWRLCVRASKNSRLANGHASELSSGSPRSWVLRRLQPWLTPYSSLLKTLEAKVDRKLAPRLLVHRSCEIVFVLSHYVLELFVIQQYVTNTTHLLHTHTHTHTRDTGWDYFTKYHGLRLGET